MPWKLWCRLCGNNSTSSQCDIDLRFVEILEKICINVPTLNSKICNKCYQFLNKIEKFSQHANKVKNLFNELELTEDSNLGITFEQLLTKYQITDFDIHEEILRNSTLLNLGIEADFTNTPSSYVSRLSSIPNSATNILNNIEIKDELNTNNNVDELVNNAAESDEEMLFKIKEMDELSQNLQLKNRENNCFNKSCQICNKVFTNLKAYNYHKIRAHKVERTCKICFKKFNNITKLKIHENTHLPPDEKLYYNCDYCDKKYTSPFQVKEHIDAIHLCICRTCKKKFITIKELRDHTKSEHSRNIPPCEICGKLFETNQKLKNHEKTHIPIEQRDLSDCPHCDRKFSSTNALKYHIISIHIAEKKFICDECGKGFIDKYRLDSHLESHKNEVHTCEVCEKKFKNRIALRKHKRTHSTKTYPCNICGAILKTPKTLRNHLVVHSNEKNYKCNYCGKLFNRDKNLRVHMIIHTNLKPYQCPFCSQSYANRSNCKKHQKQSHPVEFSVLQAEGAQQMAVVPVPSLEQLQKICEQMKQHEVNNLVE